MVFPKAWHSDIRVGLFALSVLLTPAASATVIVNGDFSSATALEGYTPTGTLVQEVSAAGNDFGQLETDGTPHRSLKQSFVVPAGPTLLSFDFAFSTAGVASGIGFPDSFAVSLITDADGDFLDILVVDVLGALADPSDGIEGITGAVPIDVNLDPSFGITGFEFLAGGTNFSGRVSLALPAAVLGEAATLYFDLFGEANGVLTRAAVDLIGAAPLAVPEPATLVLVLAGGAGLAGARRRARARRSA